MCLRDIFIAKLRIRCLDVVAQWSALTTSFPKLLRERDGEVLEQRYDVGKAFMESRNIEV